MSSRKEEALELFKSGKYNCAQTLFLVYYDELDIDKETLLKLTSGFEGGICKLGETCGLINSSVMLLGLKYGYTEMNEIDAKEKLRKKVRRLIKEFKDDHKSINCRDLLTEDKECTYKMHSRKCEDLVSEVCDILEEYM